MPAKGRKSMQRSIFLAQLMGPVLLAAAIGLLVDRTRYLAMAREFLASPALIFLSGLLTMTAGVAIVLYHNVWVAGWPVVLTLFGWLGAIGGAARIALPQLTRSVGEKMLDKPAVTTVGGAAWAAVGALLCYFGYLA
jgi:hypothetical protein